MFKTAQLILFPGSYISKDFIHRVQVLHFKSVRLLSSPANTDTLLLSILLM